MASKTAGIEIPDGFRLHTENTSHILLSSDEAFLNPVQEFNRDLSVACIRVWSEEMDKTKEARRRKAQEKKAKHKPISNQKGSNICPFLKTIKNDWIAEESTPLVGKDVELDIVNNIASSSNIANIEVTKVNDFHEYYWIESWIIYLVCYSINHTNSPFLRHFRQRDFVQYAMQKKFLSSSKLVSVLSASVYIHSRYVIANDLSPAAVNAMKRNVAINGLGDEVIESESSITCGTQAKVQVNEGDAWWACL